MIEINTEKLINNIDINGVNLKLNSSGKYKVKKLPIIEQENIYKINITDLNNNRHVKSIVVNRDSSQEVKQQREEFLSPEKISSIPKKDAVAIIIGIQDYKNLPKALYANSDAKLFYDYAIRSLGVTPDNIRLMTDSRANRNDLILTLKKWLPDDILLQIAKENAVAETAFFIQEGDVFHLRWFTPDLEMDLCGHATLATSFVIHSCLDYPSDEMHFKTMSGDLTVNYTDNRYHLDFPSRKPEKAQLPSEISEALNIQPLSVYKSRDYMLVYDNENEVKNIKIDRQIFDNINLGHGGVIVTSKGESVDFVSRFFTPQATILEDPVTGSAHCTLTPYWSKILNKSIMNAQQISKRKGELICELKKDRVFISGKAITYLKGHIIL